MAYCIGLANQKGGVGKTTTCVNLAASLAARSKQVLLIDMDPQGNATTGSGVDKGELLASSNQLLLGLNAVEECVMPTSGGYDLIPANSELTQAEVELINLPEREIRLRKTIQSVQSNYDVILIDCPPSLNMLTVNSLVAANALIVPVQCEYYALEGLTALLATIRHIQNSANPSLKIMGILRTMYDGRNTLTMEVSEQLTSNFPGQVFETLIPRNVRLAEAPSYGFPALLYDPNASGTKAYLALADEVLNKLP